MKCGPINEIFDRIENKYIKKIMRNNILLYFPSCFQNPLSNKNLMLWGKELW